MRLTVMSYNIRAGRNTPDGLEAVARVIAAHQPDVLGLQELDRNWARTGHVDQTAWLAARLGLHAVYAPAFSPAPGAEYGIALLARVPISAHHVHRLHKPDGRPEVEQRVLLLARLAGPTPYPLTVGVTHFDLAADVRVTQAQQVGAWAPAWAGTDPLLVLGDFNAQPGSPEITHLRTAFTDAWGDRPESAHYTFPSGAPGTRTPDGWTGGIDYIFLGPGWRVHSCAVRHDLTCASDHQPVVAVLETVEGG